MTLLQDSDPRFQRLNLKVLVFVVLGVIASLALLFMLAEQQGYFSRKTDLWVEAPTGTDLRSGMAVKLSGFKIGEVASVELNEDARVDVRLRIEDQYLKWIKADSLVSVAREGLIGDSYLSVMSGSATLPSLQNGDHLVFEPTPALADIAADLRMRTLPVIDGTTKLLGYLNDPKGDFRVAMADLRRLTAELHETRKRLDVLVTDVDVLAREDVKRTLANTDRALATLEREMTSMSARTDQSLAKLDETTARAKQAADSTTRAIDTASPRINKLVEEAGAAVRDARKLMDGAGKRWPFKGGKVPQSDAEAKAAMKALEAVDSAAEKNAPLPISNQSE